MSSFNNKKFKTTLTNIMTTTDFHLPIPNDNLNTTKNYLFKKKIIFDKPEDKNEKMKKIFEDPEEYLKTNENIIVGTCIYNVCK